MSEVDPEGHFAALCAKVDAFFAEVQARHGASMQCASGCYDCCQAGLSVTLVEAAAIVRKLAGADAAIVRALAETAAAQPADRCVALDAEGRCRIYDARPLVCRSHGVPIRRREPGKSLPVVDVCYRNFAGPGQLEAVPESDQLDQVTLSTMLAAVDAAFADAAGAPRGTRIDLAELLADPHALFSLD